MQNSSRRDVLRLMGSAALAAGKLRPASVTGAPTAPVALTRCRDYESDLEPSLSRIFDQIGGLGRLVKGKTVGIKLNLNAGPSSRLGHLPLGDSHWPHPRLIAATLHLMNKAGARRVVLFESEWLARPDPLEESMLQADWDLSLFSSAFPKVEYVNTNGLAHDSKFTQFPVPGGGLLFPSYTLHSAYADCDVFASIAKFKDHGTVGVTVCMKNLFGMTPLTHYSSVMSEDISRMDVASGGRESILHNGASQPRNGAAAEIDPKSPRSGGYRVPRAVVDLNAARPVHLAIVDGVRTMAGGQNPGKYTQPVSPGVLLVGTNVVTTDVVSAMVMSYDPTGDRGQTPFDNCDSKFRLSEQVGLGTCDPKRIEIIGPRPQEVAMDFRTIRDSLREKRRREMPPGGRRGA
jgi:uncharacterized protein (DUF362 family)